MTKEVPPTFDELWEAWEAYLKASEPYEVECRRYAKAWEEWHRAIAERAIEIAKEDL